MLTRYLGFAPIIGLVLSATYVSAALINVSDVLPDDVTAVMNQVASYHDTHDDHGASGLDLMTGGYGLPEWWSTVLRLILISLYLGGVPVAVMAIVLAARTQRLDRRWSAAWTNVFLAGFAFQIGSLLFTALPLYVFLVVVGYGYDTPSQAVFGALLLAGSVACSAIALWSWHVLRGAVVTELSQLRIRN